MLTIDSSMYNDKVYDGTESKCGVTVDSIDYLLKRQKRNYNNVLSEHIGSSIINALGGTAHETMLASENGATVVLCKDFTHELGSLVSFGAIDSSSIDTDKHRHDYYFDEVLYMLGCTHGTDSTVVNKFLEMYVFDSLLGNPDRHMFNWGLCCKDNVKIFAPIYDNGASLYPRANWSDLSPDWLRERIVKWPNSKIMFGTRERSSYYQQWRNKSLPSYAYAYAATLDITKAVNWLYNQTYLSEEAKLFYSTVVVNRFKVILRGEEVSWI